MYAQITIDEILAEPVEVWKPVVGYEGIYQVSSLGRIWSERFQKIMSTHPMAGYFGLCLCKDGKRASHFLHRLVAEAFLLRSAEQTQVNHKSLDRTDNSLENLEWTTPSENRQHYYKHRRNSKPIKVKQYSFDGTYLETYKSLSNAQAVTGVDKKSISHCCKGTYRQAGGFVWKFAKEENHAISLDQKQTN